MGAGQFLPTVTHGAHSYGRPQVRRISEPILPRRTGADVECEIVHKIKDRVRPRASSAMPFTNPLTDMGVES